jgi:uncharacterized protein (TIGR00725 family)
MFEKIIQFFTKKEPKSPKITGEITMISVIGGSDINSEVERTAHQTGVIVAKVGAYLICGGLKGAMEAASRGAKEAGGVTIGLLPGKDKNDANPFIDIALPTTIGYARNAMVAASGDIIIALPGSHGTRSEISFGLVYRKPVIDLGNWNIEGMIKVSGVEALESTLRGLMENIKNARTSGS